MRKQEVKKLKFGWCASQNHDRCPLHLDGQSVRCACWCHPTEAVAA